MRIAFITSLLPAGPAQSGFEIANAAVLQALDEAGCDVHLFGFLRSEEMHAPPPASTVINRLVIENAAASRARKVIWLAQAFKRGLPVICAKLALADHGHLRVLLKQHGQFDAVVINSAPVAGAFPWLAQDYPALLVAHNVEHATAAQNARSTGGLISALYRREAKLLHGIEHRALADCRYVWCFTQEDRIGFGVDIMGKSAVLPLLLPEGSVLPVVEPAHDIGLIGTWTWQPNLAGLRWFLDAVVPRLPADFSIGIAGRLPPGVGAPARVTMLGRVADAGLFVAACRVMALASRTGTGVQLKTIETFQAGLPAVATPSSVRGFNQLPGNCLVADDAEGFAAALIKLVRDVRAERSGRVDPALFISRQRQHLSVAVQSGLDAMRTA
jgi:glycosyltransferase involved in cell wall biosynthesis